MREREGGRGGEDDEAVDSRARERRRRLSREMRCAVAKRGDEGQMKGGGGEVRDGCPSPFFFRGY